MCAIDVNQMPLFAAAHWPHPQSPDVASLAQLAKERGIDFATAAAYRYLRETSPHAEFIQSIGAMSDDSPDVSPGFRIGVVPGAFFREYPAAGGDGRQLVEVLTRLGYRHDVLPLPSFRRLADGAACIRAWLRNHRDEPVVLVSLSKGGGEVKLALAQEAELFENVLGWVTLSGILEGTALINWLRRQPLRSLAVRTLFWWYGYSFAGLHDLRRAEDSPLSGPLVLPEHLLAIHVVGFPLREHLTSAWGKRGHRRLAPLGPNDGGGVLLGDAIGRPGLIYPVWGADHYLQPGWDIRQLIVRLLRYLEEEALCRKA
jgi:hypothetical protein